MKKSLDDFGTIYETGNISSAILKKIVGISESRKYFSNIC